MEDVVFEIIINAGAARGFAYDALSAARGGDYDGAKDFMRQADQEVGKAHKAQTSVIQAEAAGEAPPVSVLFVHAQDQLMTTMSEMQLIGEMIEMYKRIEAIENK